MSKTLSNLQMKVMRLDALVEEIKQDVEELRKAELERDFAQAFTYVPNRERKAVIERAKIFVERLSEGMNVEFIVDAEKRTVVCLIRGVFTNNVIRRGIAKAVEGDVFNKHIGKAIAIAKARRISIPDEFINAPQPDHAEVGDIVRSDMGLVRVLLERAEHYDCVGHGRAFKTGTMGWLGENQFEIIDDTKGGEF